MRPIQTVLLIDDDPTEAALVEYGMSKASPDTIFHYEQDSRLALDRIRETRPDLILLDIFMPSPDGFTVADAIHETLGADAPTVIAFSSTVDDLDMIDGEIIWADACLCKPTDPAHYPATISAALEFWRRTGEQPRTPVRSN